MNDFARSERTTTMNNALMLKYGQQLAEAHQMAKALGNDTIGVKKIFNTLFNSTTKILLGINLII